VYGTESPRVSLGASVSDALFRGELVAAHALLVKEGVTTLAWHPDVFRADDREQLESALARLDPAPVVSTDGGDHVVAYAIPERAPTPDAPSPESP
jgi:hypothetical protein